MEKKTRKRRKKICYPLYITVSTPKKTFQKPNKIHISNKCRKKKKTHRQTQKQPQQTSFFYYSAPFFLVKSLFQSLLFY
nr:hypothetical protein F22O13.14 - Arabidopsis thaliana [Arabidopsis thaliana]